MRKYGIVLIVMALLLGCHSSTGLRPPDDRSEETGIELAPYMAQLQRYSQKLGYSIAEKNQRLSHFYLDELGEALEKIEEKVPMHDGFEISKPVRVIMYPILRDFESELETPNWPKLAAKYNELIEGCNRCHGATEHEFIRIVPAKKVRPYNQLFHEELE